MWQSSIHVEVQYPCDILHVLKLLNNVIFRPQTISWKCKWHQECYTDLDFDLDLDLDFDKLVFVFFLPLFFFFSISDLPFSFALIVFSFHFSEKKSINIMYETIFYWRLIQTVFIKALLIKLVTRVIWQW